MKILFKTLLMLGCIFCNLCFAADWSRTEVRFVKTKLEDVNTHKDIDTNVLTFQHSSGWKYGTNFFFIDHTTTSDNHDFYGEWYPFFSSKKIFAIDYEGALSDVGLLMGFNAAPEVDVLKYLPGIQLEWNIPGVTFFSTAVTAYIDQSKGTIVPQEDDSYMIDIVWKYLFDIGQQSFSFEGHTEYIGGRDLKDGSGRLKSWILAQPQLRWDAGKTVFGEKGLLELGLEYQYHRNKFGVSETENAVKFLLIWGF